MLVAATNDTRLRERRRSGLLGGTFDPIHKGHLAAADGVRTALWLDEILLIPSHTPPHRQLQYASPFHRFAMTALAANTRDGLVASDLELQEQGPSYTGATLRRLHSEGLSPSQLFFIVGADAFAEIETWKDYPALLSWSHFIVIPRPGYPLDALRRALPDEVLVRLRDREDLEKDPALTGVSFMEIATPDVSSTQVRDRLALGESISNLVTPAVELHIRKHRLYQRNVPTATSLHDSP